MRRPRRRDAPAGPVSVSVAAASTDFAPHAKAKPLTFLGTWIPEFVRGIALSNLSLSTRPQRSKLSQGVVASRVASLCQHPRRHPYVCQPTVWLPGTPPRHGRLVAPRSTAPPVPARREDSRKTPRSVQLIPAPGRPGLWTRRTPGTSPCSCGGPRCRRQARPRRRRRPPPWLPGRHWGRQSWAGHRSCPRPSAARGQEAQGQEARCRCW